MGRLAQTLGITTSALASLHVKMRNTQTIFAATSLISFVIGCTLTYALLVREAAHWMETQPTLILSEQTNILMHLRAGKEQEITQVLEEVVWLQISMHAKRLDEGTLPLESLRSAIAYHCKINAASANPSNDRNQWCAALTSKWPQLKAGDA